MSLDGTSLTTQIFPQNSKVYFSLQLFYPAYTKLGWKEKPDDFFQYVFTQTSIIKLYNLVLPKNRIITDSAKSSTKKRLRQRFQGQTKYIFTFRAFFKLS